MSGVTTLSDMFYFDKSVIYYRSDVEHSCVIPYFYINHFLLEIQPYFFRWSLTTAVEKPAVKKIALNFDIFFTKEVININEYQMIEMVLLVCWSNSGTLCSFVVLFWRVVYSLCFLWHGALSVFIKHIEKQEILKKTEGNLENSAFGKQTKV